MYKEPAEVWPHNWLYNIIEIRLEAVETCANFCILIDSQWEPLYIIRLGDILDMAGKM